jgi:hypothetical protein
MISALALATLALTAPAEGYSSWIKDGEVHFRFYDLTKIYGPFKFYVSGNAVPLATCATCPTDGVTPEYVVPPEAVFQKYPQSCRCAEASFPVSAVGNMEYFYFTAVTVMTSDDRYLGAGVVPHYTGKITGK